MVMPTTNALSNLKPGRRFVIGLPLVWLVVFFLLPFLILLRISVTDMAGGIDPFAPLLNTTADTWHLLLKVDNYRSIFVDMIRTIENKNLTLAGTWWIRTCLPVASEVSERVGLSRLSNYLLSTRR